MGNERLQSAKTGNPMYDVIVPFSPFLCDTADMPTPIALYREDDRNGMKMSQFMKGRHHSTKANLFPWNQRIPFWFSPSEFETGIHDQFLFLDTLSDLILTFILRFYTFFQTKWKDSWPDHTSVLFLFTPISLSLEKRIAA